MTFLSLAVTGTIMSTVNASRNEDKYDQKEITNINKKDKNVHLTMILEGNERLITV